ncbi:hypothetical protein QAD02_024005 [Eretmocerus hayati]|uniref:Uncharacterized protein n=1 Tax=Eretmocerus hayati TaxID=131215 RepID=A0ACC2PX81_9HYME|nr:hypothetical protein QAD02_024005 [Eretmocerus hayati]
MAAPRREFLRRPDVPRRRSARQALASIPDLSTLNVSSVIEPSTIRRYSTDSHASAPSPDELIIQTRGRRKSIVWSPESDAHKRDHSLFRDRTPGNSPAKPQSSADVKSTPRKRLNLDDMDVEMVTPEKKMKLSPKKFTGNLENGLKGLSHEQLVRMIMDLVSLQENDKLQPHDRLRNVVLDKMPIADIQPLQERLANLRQSVYASLVSSNVTDSDYSRAYVHLENYLKTLRDQGLHLVESQHWAAVMQYVFAAWPITKDLPEWKDHGMHSTTQKCYKQLTDFCLQGLRNGTFTSQTLSGFKERMLPMLEDFCDISICLQFINSVGI